MFLEIVKFSSNIIFQSYFYYISIIFQTYPDPNMQETWLFKIEQNHSSLENLIQDVLEKERKDLGIFLSYYFKREGAVTENVALRGEIDFTSELQGNFILDFDLVHFNACLNIHDTKRDEIKVDFELSIDMKELKLIGPYFPERGMDEI